MMTKLSEDRRGNTLDSGLVAQVATYLIKVAGFKDVDKWKDSDLLETATELWMNEREGAALPTIFRRQILAWVGGSIGPPVYAPPLAPARSDVDGSEFEGEEDESVLFGPAGATPRDLAKLAADKSTQNLSGARILILSAALELGRVPAAGEVIGSMTYRSDPRLGDLAKQQRKAGMATLSKILDSTDSNRRGALQTHFGGVIRDYSERAMIQEASWISQFWAETQTISSDDKVLVEYIKEWLKKYPGCGIPMVIDVIIATRVCGMQKTSGGISTDKFNELLTLVKSSKSEVSSLKSELGSLKAQVKSLSGKKGGDDGDKLGPKCHKCGEYGHIAKFCPNKNKKKGEDEDEEANKSDE